MSASMKGYTAIVNVLLQAGADEEAKKEEVSLLWFTTEKYCRFRVDEVGTLISTVEKICAVFIALISPPPPPYYVLHVVCPVLQSLVKNIHPAHRFLCITPSFHCSNSW